MPSWNAFGWPLASALAEIDPTLLAKSDPPPRSSGGAFARGQEAFLTTGRFPANPDLASEGFTGAMTFPRKGALYTPPARMMERQPARLRRG
jgi:hypothetical protein